MVAWFGNLTVFFRSQLNRLVHTAMKVVGLGVYPNLQSIFDKIIFKQARKMTLAFLPVIPKTNFP